MKKGKKTEHLCKTLPWTKKSAPSALAASLAKLLLGKSFNTRTGKQLQRLESLQPLTAIRSARGFEVP